MAQDPSSVKEHRVVTYWKQSREEDERSLQFLWLFHNFVLCSVVSLQCGDQPWAFVTAVTLYTASGRTYSCVILSNKQAKMGRGFQGFFSESVPFCGNGNCEVEHPQFPASVSMVTTIPEEPRWATAAVLPSCPHCGKVGSRRRLTG